MAEDRARLQSLTDEYQDLQNDLSNLVSARQKLESQQQENQSVQKVTIPPNSSTT
jgi:prefoldin beta subunit